MTVGLLKDIVDQRPEGRLLGFDVGKKTIGLALSNPNLTVATPLKTIQRTKFTQDIQELSQVIEEYEITGYVLGLPLNMDGSEGPRAQSVRDFALEMEKQLPVILSPPSVILSDSEGSGSHLTQYQPDPSVAPLLQDDRFKDPWIALWDERLSTVSVEGAVDNYVEKRKTKSESKSSGLIDKLAAQVILQGALEFIRDQT